MMHRRPESGRRDSGRIEIDPGTIYYPYWIVFYIGKGNKTVRDMNLMKIPETQLMKILRND